MVTKRSGQAQTALISRRPATVERTRGVDSPRKDQGDNKPSTNWRLGQTDSDSQTKRVKFFGRLEPSGSWVAWEPPFRSAARHKASANQSFAELQAQAAASFQTSSGVKSGCQNVAAPRRAAPIRDSGEGSRHKGSRNQRRALGRFAGRKAIRIRLRASTVRSWSPKSSAFVGSLPDAGHGRRERAQREPELATRRTVRSGERQSKFADWQPLGHGRQSLPPS